MITDVCQRWRAHRASYRPAGEVFASSAFDVMPALLGCSPIKVPLARRVLYALAVYTGQRKGSLFAMKWKHADFGPSGCHPRATARGATTGRST
jgi:integrase